MTERFDGLAEAYAAFRPGYPVQMFQDIAASLATPLRRAVDVGAGPGNSTQSLRQALGPDWVIAAVEPGRDMRRVLTRRFEGASGLMILGARAEALPLPAGFAALATICTAWHWLNPDRTMAEMGRILAPGGVLAILRHQRLSHPVLAAFDAYVAQHSTQGEDYQRRNDRKLPGLDYLGAQNGFADPQTALWPWYSDSDCRRLIDLWLTRSTVWDVVRRIGLDRVLQDLSAICHDMLPEGRLRLHWQTEAQ
ncbi:MAG: class I SAM-dependent methyltransferase, partial [Rhodobacteraceae bacterium]|nr:class I SAM-dependent methyltransferase [Paracoccaceae bacterium]